MKDVEEYLTEMEKIANMPMNGLADSVKAIREYEKFFKSVYMDGFNDGVNTSITSLEKDANK